MAHAYKNYNNKQYHRKANGSVLDAFVKKFSNETTAPYQTYPNQRKAFVDRSVQNLAVNSIIEGYFPKENLVRQMAIKRVNKTLCVIISLLIAVVVVSYYFVISCEIKLNDLSRQTVILNNENADLQNQLDSLKSFSNVDRTLQKNNTLKRAGHVIETLEVTTENNEPTTKKAKKRVFNYALGF